MVRGIFNLLLVGGVFYAGALFGARFPNLVLRSKETLEKAANAALAKVQALKLAGK